MTESAEQRLSGFEQGLSGLKGNALQVADNDASEGAAVILNFSDGAILRADYWRLLRNSLAVVSSFDHQQKYGLPSPVDARADLRKALNGQQVLEARLDKPTGDFLFAFSGQAHFQVFNLTGYEIWEMSFADGSGEYSNHVLSYLYQIAAR